MSPTAKKRKINEISLFDLAAIDDDINVDQKVLKKTKADDPDMFFKIGEKHNEGGKYTTALEWFKKAAELGHGQAHFEVGYIYQEGLGVEQDYKRAYEWYLKGSDSEHNNNECQNGVGVLHQCGFGVKKNLKKAMEWYTKAEKNGSVDAKNNIGYLCENGYGLSRSYKKALWWYTSAESCGSSSAQNNIGCLHRDGKGVIKDRSVAIEYFLKAVKKRNKNAMFNLAATYEEEEEVQDLKKALFWYKKALDNGYEEASSYVDRLLDKGYRLEDGYDPVSDNITAKSANTNLDETESEPKSKASSSEIQDLVDKYVEGRLRTMQEVFEAKIKTLETQTNNLKRKIAVLSKLK